MELDLIVENGLVVLPDGALRADVAVRGGKIVAVGDGKIFPRAKRRIDASGKIVLPGMIDTHTHFEITLRGAKSPEGWDQATTAAAFGGVTTCIDFVWQGVNWEERPSLNLAEVLKAKVERVSKMAAVDFSFHGTFTDTSDMDRVIEGVKQCVEYGISSFKIFMGQSSKGMNKSDKRAWWVDDWGLYNVMQEAKKYNAIVGVHAENSTIADALMERHVKEGKTDAIYLAMSKPNFIEEEAVQRAITIAKATGARLYIAHLSTKEGVGLIRAARASGIPVYAETVPHYLTLTDEMYRRPDGLLFMGSPPLRKQEDIDALWRGLADGSVSFMGTDHLGLTKEQKLGGATNFTEARGGRSVVELLLPILYSEGVAKGRLSLPRLVQVCSTNAAKMFDVYPRKGTLAPGSDADIVLLDPELEKTITIENLHVGSNWTPYAGMKVKGWPVMTILRGAVIVEGGSYMGKSGDGQFVKAAISPEDIRAKMIG